MVARTATLSAGSLSARAAGAKMERMEPSPPHAPGADAPGSFSATKSAKEQGALFDPPEPTAEEIAAGAAMAWESAAAEDRVVADVVLNKPLMDAYTYLVPENLRDEVVPGRRVRVPFGRGPRGGRSESGFVVAVRPVEEYARERGAKPERLKTIDRTLDEAPLVDAKMLALSRWIAEYYLCGWGQVLSSIVPAGVKRNAGTRELVYYKPTATGRAALDAGSLTKKQRAVMAALIDAGEPVRADYLAGKADCGVGVVTGLKHKGFAEQVVQRTDVTDFGDVEIEPWTELTATEEQQAALDAILTALREREYATFLLHGVTGSGKTEVYIRAIKEVVEYGRQAIVLVPEIALTPQTIRRFRQRFERVAVLHSHLSDAERSKHWRDIAAGRVEVVVGARSAIFAPTTHLGLVIIDEEHESTFKQDSVPRYHAREVAEKRCREAGVPLVLGSATPTLESWHAAQEGRYRLLSLLRRVGKLPLPPVVTVDVRNDPQVRKGRAIGRQLTNAVKAALEDGGQVILFLNLRGFSPAVWCRACGASLKCPDCDVSLTWHRDKGRAVCHSCDHEQTVPRACPGCGAHELKYVGVGTQKLEEEVRQVFPEAEIARMDSDSMRKPGSHDKVLTRFRAGEIDILLGTQMIAKGLDFPNVTLVGVVDADTQLHQPDPRAGERTFQLIAQVAGRTGRSSRGGRVYVQSSNPAEPAIRRAAGHDYLGFVADELRDRWDMSYPPYRRLCRVILRGPDEAAVKRRANEMANALAAAAKAQNLPVQILGPAPCAVARLQKNWRFHFQLSGENPNDVRTLWRTVEPEFPTAGDVDYVVDMDPLNMR
ncbi:replication restart helicase PriA [Alienimonas californiensis]|uniref:Replication restart protein PriA n=1 Tax=Alienimonas californiensis TaxID=2527989 RepID=A0A517PDE4_9PLAN|nr:primosomal protein N' [Alienimonas californiensis]QDT17402.1 Primosomal protein N' [Alienimonas californiensis]